MEFILDSFELLPSEFLKNYSRSYPAIFYLFFLASVTILFIILTVLSEHFLLTYPIASLIPLYVRLRVRFDWLFLRSSFEREGWLKTSSSSLMESRVKLSWVVEMSLFMRLSLIFSMNASVFCMRSIYFCRSCPEACFMNWEQI